MLIRFSVANNGGNEIIKYEQSLTISKNVIDMDLVSNFMQAMQMFSESLGTSIKEIVFSNFFLYLRTYGDFSVRLLLDEKPQMDLNPIFEGIAKIVLELLSTHSQLVNFSDEIVKERFLPILKPFISLGDETHEEEYQFKSMPLQNNRPKIAIVGLEKAGKTSLKKAFFEKWSNEQIKKIRPTLGVEMLNKKVDYIGEQFTVMDFGGQLAFRKMYLKNKLKWKGISILIFLIDVQRIDAYEEAVDYLKNVWEIAKSANKIIPRLSIFFHKFDAAKRMELTPSLGRCLMLLSDIINEATIYTTTIEDGSCITALIKSIYFSSPGIVIKKIFDEIILADFEESILEKFMIPGIVWDDNSQEVQEKLMNVKVQSKQLGKSFGLKLQEVWFDYFSGDWAPKTQQLKWNILEIEKGGREIFVRIRNWVDPTTDDKALILTIFDGLMEGIAVTLQMPKPRRIEEEEFFGSWRLLF
jgi:signal recognition particle receptor subunit beta